MDEESRIALEGRIQDCLAGRLGHPGGLAGLLALIARDPEARDVVREVLSVQRLAREAVGGAVGESGLADSLARTLAALRSIPLGAADTAAKPVRGGSFGLTARAAWSLRVAAAFVIATSLYLAFTARRDSEALREQLAKIGRAHV